MFGAAETAGRRPYYSTKGRAAAPDGPTPAICMNMETPDRIRGAVELGPSADRDLGGKVGRNHGFAGGAPP